MSAPWTERKGGIWPSRASAKGELVYEEYDSARDALMLIWQRESDGFFEIQYLLKGKVDPQWSLPFWENIAGLGIFENKAHATLELVAFADNNRRE